MFAQKRNIRIEVTKDKTLVDLKGLSAEEAIKIIETAQAVRSADVSEDNSPKQ
ncbi:hypothetical protein PXH59_17190 [Xenorhabdus sp. SF857]|uniref:hypothetical protein n=1 Tax=Xenorhabdus bakwenae TaxID=3026967 RepID=UPI002557EE87|nr:hypothetical protein [Xenorhabdus sp. SF857]WFQ79304.1 hypothetical protein PXH59_17190 [Xenorhabdus sp. SF857]